MKNKASFSPEHSSDLLFFTTRQRLFYIVGGLCFFLGSLTGALIPSMFPALFSGLFVSDYSHRTLLTDYWISVRPCLIAAFLATSYTGVYLLPVLFACRGFLVSWSVYALLRLGCSVMNVFLRIGVPAFFSVCALFLLGEAAWRSAARLNLLNSRFVFRTEPAITGRTLFAFVLLIMLAALSRRFLIP